MANERDETDDTHTDSGRAISIDSSPEGNLMSIRTVRTGEPASLTPEMRDAEAQGDVDDRAADEARMEVRRREHSAD